MHVTAIIAAAGEGRRLGAAVPKQLLQIGDRSILERSVAAFATHHRVDDVIVVLPAALAAAPPDWLIVGDVRVVAGGSRRQDSVANAFDRVLLESDVVLVHDAARPFVSPVLISRSIDAAAEHGAAIAALPASDTVKRVEGAGAGTVIVETIPRARVYLAQTPQAFRREILSAAVALGRTGVDATDEAMLAERAGHRVHVVEGDPANVKITTARDLDAARRQSVVTTRIGTGYDLHRLVEGRALIIGGVTIPFEKGAVGHSDADVVCHAVIDAILGAASAGNVGQHYPDTDPRWKDAPSIPMLRDSLRLVHARGFAVENVDVTVVLERPKIASYVDRIREQLAEALEIAVDHVSVKGKTNEGVDAVGRGEAIAAHAVALLSASPVGRGLQISVPAK
jgi:2-C-methyl-D-erythritol 4-phosphate cytidylyltransferase/2-C-methyl-D-erythritol 2,4-cyclodiphosphate synthase